jgi:hypothetical protein
MTLMNQPSNDSQLRELFQRLKAANAQDAPTFAEVVARRTVIPEARHARGIPLVASCALTVLVLAAVLFIQLQSSGMLVERSPMAAQDQAPEQPTADSQVVAAAEVPFNDWNRAIADYFNGREASYSVGQPIWSSGTEALLVYNFTPMEVED